MKEFRMSLLKERADAIHPDLTKARQMMDKAENEKRELTDAEKAFVEPTLKSARDIADNMARVRDEDATMKAINDEFGDVMGGLSHGDLSSSGSPSKSRRLSFSGMGTKVAKQMLPDGMKSLAPSGAAVVGQEFKPDPVALGKPATALLDVLPVVGHSSPEFSYLRQTTRTNTAAVVAEGATKPTSVYSVTRTEAALVVVAHLSEAVPRFWLLDNTSLDRFVEAELDSRTRWLRASPMP